MDEPVGERSEASPGGRRRYCLHAGCRWQRIHSAVPVQSQRPAMPTIRLTDGESRNGAMVLGSAAAPAFGIPKHTPQRRLERCLAAWSRTSPDASRRLILESPDGSVVGTWRNSRPAGSRLLITNYVSIIGFARYSSLDLDSGASARCSPAVADEPRRRTIRWRSTMTQNGFWLITSQGMRTFRPACLAVLRCEQPNRRFVTADIRLGRDRRATISRDRKPAWHS